MTEQARGGGGRDRRGRTTRARRATADPAAKPSRTRRAGTADANKTGDKAGDKAADKAADKTTGARRARRTTDADSVSTTGRRADAKDLTRTRRTSAGQDAAARRATRTRAARPDEPGRRSGRSAERARPAARRPRSTEVVVRAGRTENGGPRATRRRYLARRWLALLVALSVAAVAYLVMFTSLLGVRSVEVVGVRQIDKDAVVRAADIEIGTPMVRLDAEAAAARVAKLPRVFEVRIERSWPSTVEVIITERAPVAVLVVGQQVHLIDETGLDYAVAATRPEGLPLLAMTGVRPQDPATRAAVAVLLAVPQQLKAQITQLTANTPGDVRLTLADGRVVKWGNARNNARKAAVLAPLLTRPGTIYDVATPDFPTVTG